MPSNKHEKTYGLGFEEAIFLVDVTPETLAGVCNAPRNTSPTR